MEKETRRWACSWIKSCSLHGVGGFSPKGMNNYYPTNLAVS